MKDIMPYLHAWLVEDLPDLAFEYQTIGSGADALTTPFVLIRDTGGEASDFPDRQAVLFSVSTYAGGEADARALIFRVDTVVRSRYDLTLSPPADMPAAEPIKIGAVVPMTAPVSLGNAGNGVYEYVATYQILL